MKDDDECTGTSDPHWLRSNSTGRPPACTGESERALELDQVASIPQDLLTGSGRRTSWRQIGSFTLPWQYCHFEFI